MILNGFSSDDFACDVCVVGTGPVGIAVALECERHGLTVLALEAGGEKQKRRVGWPGRASSGSSHSHAPVHVTTRSAFGGTSWAWAGGCVAFDDIDFDNRMHVADSGWPLAHGAVAPYYDAAARILNASPSVVWHGDSAGRDDRMLGETDFVVSAQPKLAVSYWEHFARSKAIALALNSRVTALNLDLDGKRIDSLSIVSGERRITLRPPRIVIAAGGLKTTQLMLATQRTWPLHFGGADGALGRYYMGHLAGSIASVTFHGPAPDKLLPLNPTGNAERRLTISRAKQISERLLNVAFWPNAPLFYDPSHGDGVLSAAVLAFAVPKLGNLLSGGLQRYYLGPRTRIGAHVMNVLGSPADTAAGLGRLLWNRVLSRPSLGARAKHAGLSAYTLKYHAESEPKRESRVSLANKMDRFGLPEMKINLLFGDNDARSIVRAHEVLDSGLRSAGIASLDYLDPADKRAANVLSQARDGYHQLGTTRMGTDPKLSVVDKDCRVHGVDNLFVASSSVFPTSGHANPTLLATALGVRLAEHLARMIKGSAVSPSADSAPPLAPRASGSSNAA